uniref:DNA mismatch repair protein MutL n=2 Tax=environmental samples TaxID=68359 RepID=A0A075FPY5_9EURY|nr:DNA mismatch repair protein (mutL) [uncultured marine group II/III euryarchaeote AD1000_34_D01]AIE98309.1 DNA mismatch repair protein (mutL) [uncultured marine group II/III euryarchaeote KM3_05_F04]
MEAVETVDRIPIKQLDDKTIGLIAAGEVVERPAQVVKELLENSVDAGSIRIQVEIQKGGFELISVTDDGHGIPPEELPLAVTRHATSKLADATDLDAISTLGFRGEALASVGAVSRLTLASRPAGEAGMGIEVADGEVGDIEPHGMAEGTSVEVRNLFENQPARLAFQRRPATETAQVVDVVVAHALCNPGVSFRLTVDGRSILETPATDDIPERLFDLLGAASERLIPLESPPADYDAPGDEKWSGFISPPDISRGRSDDIHLIINNRPVAAQPFLKSIRRGYHTRLMVGRHPVAVLHLEIPNDEVDVNVHPTKREVRLKNSWRVLERLERALKHTLKQIPTGGEPTEDFPLGAIDAPNAPNRKPPRAGKLPSWVKRASTASTASATTETAEISATDSGDKSSTQTSFYQGAKEELKGVPKARPVSTAPSAQELLPGLSEEPTAPALSSDERDLHRYAGRSTAVSPLDEPELSPLETEITEVPVMEPLAQFADSYILAQGDGALYLVDQHALHERVRYERLRHKMGNWEPQPLIEPISLDLSPVQTSVVHASQVRLAELGFQFTGEGALELTAVPVILAGDDRLKGFLEDLIGELQESGGDGPLDVAEKLADEIAFMRSCRGAVKANQTLNLAEMRRLLSDMGTIENPWACVHGRPTVLKLDVDQLDEHFGRHG